MFERFTAGARQAVVEAQEVARAGGAREIEPGHLLAGVVRGEGREGGLLTAFGVPLADISADLDRVRRRGGISDADVEALSELGIDVERIVERVEEAHGEGALATGGFRVSRGHLPFRAETKAALTGSLREATLAGDRHIGQEHLLLSLAALPGPVADLLARHGVEYGGLRAVLRERKAG